MRTQSIQTGIIELSSPVYAYFLFNIQVFTTCLLFLIHAISFSIVSSISVKIHQENEFHRSQKIMDAAHYFLYRFHFVFSYLMSC